MKHISIIIPTYTLNKELEMLAATCIDSFGLQGSEIIVAEDGGFFSPILLNKATHYLYKQENRGFVKNVNDAWRLARGEYVAIVNSDTMLRKGNLDDLCIPGKITSPVTVNQNVEFMAGHFFVVPRKVGVAFLDERLINHCSDAHMEKVYKDIIMQVPSVEIYHEINATLRVAGVLNGDPLEEDRKTYESICFDSNN